MHRIFNPKFLSICALMCSHSFLEGQTVEVEADYFLAWRKERETPPLITTAPAGVNPNVGKPETTIFFGGKIDDSPQSGVRGAAAVWFSECFALGASGFWVNDETKSRSIASDANGVPSIGVPHFELISNVEGVTDIALEGNFAGSAKASTTNQVWGADGALQWKIVDNCGFSLKLLAGYQYYSVRDKVTINADSQFLLFENTATIYNGFETDNIFNGGLLGAKADFTIGCFGLSLLAKVGLGEMRSTIDIKGEGVITHPTGQFIGFVQDTNRGSYRRCQFSAVPEVAAKLFYSFYDCFSIALGYTLVYWPDVYLAGNQIDRRLNSLQPSDFPVFLDNKSDFWLQGLTVGLGVAF